jgi:hypothetical protein
MSRCYGNETNCLLGELVDQGDGFDWNPLNFAFTAALSSLALLVAFLALLQGLLAAGPGRLKASKSAVGPIYGCTARTRFDWTELRFRTVVQVPVIDIAQIIAGLSTIEAHRTSRQASSLRVALGRCLPCLWPDLPRKAEKRRRRLWPCLHSAQFSSLEIAGRDVEARIPDHGEDSRDLLASWSRLLHDVGLDASKLRTKIIKTDHLPSDIPAAPAFATVDVLVILSILAGCTSYYVNQEFPFAKGPHLQLTFRDHQQLGLVATYQNYKEMHRSASLTYEYTRSGCIEALGHLKYLQDPLCKL